MARPGGRCRGAFAVTQAHHEHVLSDRERVQQRARRTACRLSDDRQKIEVLTDEGRHSAAAWLRRSSLFARRSWYQLIVERELKAEPAASLARNQAGYST